MAEFLNHLKYKLLNCLIFDAFWMLTGREFQTEAPENVNDLLWRIFHVLEMIIFRLMYEHEQHMTTQHSFLMYV